MNNNNGFTIIELLLIILIISILVMIAYPRLIGLVDRANDTNIVSDLGVLHNFMNMYYQDYNKYPETTSENELVDLVNNKLEEYGKITNIFEHIKSDNYYVNNNSEPKTFTLIIISNNTNKEYILTPNDLIIND